MKVMVSTTLGQGVRSNDFSFADEGELVTFTSECDREPVDGDCGCRRAMCGVTSRKSTTTFWVCDRDMTRADLITALRASLTDGGWDEFSEDGEMDEWATTDADELLRMAGHFPIGMVLEKRGTKFQERRIPAGQLN